MKVSKEERQRLPVWLKKGIINPEETREVREILKKFNLNTVCDSARCPNKCECYTKNTATFLIMGKNCTRNCKFCAVDKECVEPLDEKEPRNIALAVKELGLEYVVITSVTRDDLDDGGASHFANTVREIKDIRPDVSIEVLVPDFKGSEEAVRTVVNSGIDVFNHNVETVKELYYKARSQADYYRSLEILKLAKSYNPDVVTKTGIMLGLGETEEQLITLFKDVVSYNIDILTIGQYIQPKKACLDVEKYYTEDEFAYIKKLAQDNGLKKVVSGALVRSSYNAFEAFKGITSF